jgi:hypothetical protein
MNKAKDSQNKTVREDTLQEISDMLQPLIDFQDSSVSSRENDLTLYWDIKVVQGKDTLFASTKGSSAMPLALAPKMVMLVPSNIQSEISQKITTPLMVTLLEKLNINGPRVESLDQQ